MLAQISGQNHDSWDENLPEFMLTVNTSRSEATENGTRTTSTLDAKLSMAQRSMEKLVGEILARQQVSMAKQIIMLSISPSKAQALKQVYTGFKHIYGA
ncbi:hypothetical protein EVAR_103777_1 [Eumeta japonica]|uniref:Uncharacterized protein n=1 Tax=Eumeta variegata TaxID=151549 RepID=A0A4C2A600_EUMVA|nr:hypothetical protein EVAR_103777_1 [Eumeta japonica]